MPRCSAGFWQWWTRGRQRLKTWRRRSPRRRRRPRRAPPACAPATCGVCCLGNETVLQQFTTWTNGALCLGMLPDNQREVWAAARSIALTKAARGHRPISIGESARRITGRAALHAHRDDIQLRFCGKDNTGNLQLSCMTPQQLRDRARSSAAHAAAQGPHAPPRRRVQRVQHAVDSDTRF